jgi:hypothetical protein
MDKRLIKLDITSRQSLFLEVRTFGEEYPRARRIVVTREAHKRITDDNIEIYPWQQFLQELWEGNVL